MGILVQRFYIVFIEINEQTHRQLKHIHHKENMARLTVLGVQKYASQYGYTIERFSKGGYTINDNAGVIITGNIYFVFSTLNAVIECIKNGYLLYGSFSVLVTTDDPIMASIGDWVEIIDESNLVPPLTKGKQFEVVEVLPAYGVIVSKKEPPHYQKCIYPNCGQPCYIECDGTLCEDEPLAEDATSFDFGDYQVPLLEKCLEISKPTLQDVVSAYNDIPLFIPKIVLGNKSWEVIKGEIYCFLNFAKNRYKQTGKGSPGIIQLVDSYHYWCKCENQWCTNVLKIIHLAYPKKSLLEV